MLFVFDIGAFVPTATLSSPEDEEDHEEPGVYIIRSTTK